MGYLIIVGVVILLLAAAAVVLGGARLQRRGSGAAGPLPYRAKDYLLSKAEQSFYFVLLQTIGSEWRVFAKVRLLDLFWIPRDVPNARGHVSRVKSKHADFVLCTPDELRPVLVIELDDASHQRESRMARDALVDEIMAAAGLPILHVSARRAYTTTELANQIRSLVSPRMANPNPQAATV